MCHLLYITEMLSTHVQEQDFRSDSLWLSLFVRHSALWAHMPCAGPRWTNRRRATFKQWQLVSYLWATAYEKQVCNLLPAIGLALQRNFSAILLALPYAPHVLSTLSGVTKLEFKVCLLSLPDWKHPDNARRGLAQIFQEDGNGEKLTVKQWWLFGCRFFTVCAEFFTVYKGRKRWKNISLLIWAFSRLVFHGLPPLGYSPKK